MAVNTANTHTCRHSHIQCAFHWRSTPRASRKNVWSSSASVRRLLEIGPDSSMWPRLSGARSCFTEELAGAREELASSTSREELACSCFTSCFSSGHWYTSHELMTISVAWCKFRLQSLRTMSTMLYFKAACPLAVNTADKVMSM